MIIEDVANKLADMPGQSLPIYPMQFPSDVVNCITVFIDTGKPSLFYTALGTLDYPAVKIRVRYTDPYNAFAIAEAIKIWMDAHLPTGYLTCRAIDPNARDITDSNSLAMSGGPAYVFEVAFKLTKVRAA
jgi:hypothetical protein